MHWVGEGVGGHPAQQTETLLIDSSHLKVQSVVHTGLWTVSLWFVLQGRIYYANPILTWLTQDQHYGGGFFSVQVHTHTHKIG